jgi:cation transport ATPase
LTAEAPRPSVRTGPNSFEISDVRVFGPGGETLARRFAGRVLAVDEVRSLALDPAQATATVNYRLAGGGPGMFLTRLACAVAGSAAEVKEVELPDWGVGEPITLYRHSDVVSIFAELSIARGCLAARLPVMEKDQAAARRVENALRVVPGVIHATATGELRARFDPHAVAALRLIRIAEAQILGREAVHSVPSLEPVNFRLENVTLGVAAVGEFVLPLLAPAASGLLVLAALNTFGAALSQLRERKIGLPLLYTCAVGTRVSNGQFLAGSLLSWFFRYWEYRYRQDVAVENRTLLDETSALPRRARLLTAGGLERLVPRQEVTAGQRVRALAGETVPVDAVVCEGAALVDHTTTHGASLPSRKLVGDLVLAGSTVLAGRLDLKVLRTGGETRAARIAEALIDVTKPAPHPEALNQQAQDFASEAVKPTLLAAGAGAVIGGLTTAGAILSPDYATGIGLTAPLETVRHVRQGLRHGAVIRTPDALDRLAKATWIVLDDHEALHRTGCDVAELRTNWLDEARLLPAMAAAGMWLGDERGPALARACRAHGLVIRRAQLHEIGGDGVAVRVGDHLLRLRGRPAGAAGAPPPLIVEVDGAEVAGVRFVRNGRLEAAAVVRRLRRDGLQIFLASKHAGAGLAAGLGADRCSENMSADDKARLLRDLQGQPVVTAYVGDCVENALAADEAHLSIDLAGADGPEIRASDIVLLTPSISALPALRALAGDGARRMGQVRHAVLLPNLLCVAGAFALGFTPMAAVFLSNFGTSVVYGTAKRALRETPVSRPDIAWGLEDGPALLQRSMPPAARAYA